jgi:GrpB-like predicted nucleotidyltransferase (UPF0157 family)
MIDPFDPELQPLSKLAKLLPGKTPHPSVLCRWHRKGVRGIKLDVVTIGRIPYSTPVALRDFIERRNHQQRDNAVDVDRKLQARGYRSEA